MLRRVWEIEQRDRKYKLIHSIIRLFKANVFYAIRAAAGRHEFAHIRNTRETRAMAWGLAMVILAMLAFPSPDLIELGVLISLILATRKMTGTKKICVLYTVSGVLLMGFVIAIPFFLSGIDLFLAIWCVIVTIWMKVALDENIARYNRLPPDDH